MTNYVLHENDINQFYFYCFLFWKWKQFMIGPIVQRFIISIFAVTMRRELFSPLKRLRFVTSKIDVGFVCAKIALKSKPEALLQLGDFDFGLGSWNNGKEVSRWGVAEIKKMSPSTTGRCYCCH